LGADAVTLSNNANLHYSRSATTNIFNTISGTGNLSATITGASSNLSVSGAVNLTGGTVNLSTDANLTVSQTLTTSNTTSAAIVLNAGAATSAGTSTGGDISFTGSGAVNVGASGRATLYTGSLSGSTGLGVTTGNNRYNSDEQTSNYTAALGSGTYAIYREAPTLNVRFNDTSKTYDAQAFTGGNGLSIVSGLVNGDTSTTFSGISYSGTAQNATNAGTFAISGTALSSQGYVLSYTNGSLTIDKANLVLSGSRDYDATTTFAGQYLTATGVSGQTFSLTGGGHSSNLSSQHVADNQNVALSSVTGLSLDASSNGGLADNYNAISATNSNTSVTRRTVTATGNSNTVTYDGVTHNISGFSVLGLQGSDVPSDLSTIVATGASGLNAGTYTNLVSAGTEANYTVNTVNGSLVIDRRDVSITGLTAADKAYDGNTSATITGGSFDNLVSGETLGLSGTGAFSSAAAGNNKTVTVTDAAALNQNNAIGLWQNYRLLSTGPMTALASITGSSGNNNNNNNSNQPGPDSGNPTAALVPSSRAPGMTYPPVEPTQLRPSLTWATRSPSPLEQTVIAVAANNPFMLSSGEPESTANDFNLVLACDNTGPEDGLKLCYER
jgi:hypothetical protein